MIFSANTINNKSMFKKSLLFISLVFVLSCFFVFKAESENKSSDYELDVIQLALNNESREVRTIAIEAVVELKASDYIPVLKNMLKDNNEFVRIKAAEAMSKLGDNSGLIEVRRLLQTKPKLSENPTPFERAKAVAKGSIRVEAATVLMNVGDNQSIPIFRSLVDDDDGRVVDVSLIALAKSGDKTVKQDFIAALENKEQRVRAKAIKALGEIGDISVAPKIRQRLKDWDREPKVEAALALAKMKDIDSIPMISELLWDQDVIVMENAALAIGLIGDADKKNTSALERLLEDENGFVRIAAGEALYLLGDDKGKDFVLKALNSDERDAKIKALTALEKMADPDDIKTLETFLDNKDSVIAVKAAKVIVMAKQRTKKQDKASNSNKEDNKKNRKK